MVGDGDVVGGDTEMSAVALLIEIAFIAVAPAEVAVVEQQHPAVGILAGAL